MTMEKCKNYRLPFNVIMLEAKMFAISISSLSNQLISARSPFPTSRIKVNQTLDSLADLREWVKKLVKSFREAAAVASM